MKPVCRIAAVLCMALVSLNAAADDAEDDLKAIQGTWDLNYFERDGKEVKLKADTKAINTGDKFVVKRGGQVIAAGSFNFDPSRTPKASNTTYTYGPDKGKTFKGIYQIDGDTMRFCRAGSPDDERPNEFKTRPGSGQFAAIYKRAPPELQVLENWVGTWDEVMTNKATEWLPKVEKSTSVTKRAWSLGGSFVRAEGIWKPAMTECLHMISYDPVSKVYRSWYFDSAGSMPRGSVTGVWNEKSRTMTWRGADEAGNKTVGMHRFIGEDHHEWSLVTTNPAGKVVLDLTGKSIRRKE